MWRYQYFFVFVFYFAATVLARAQIFGNVLAPDKTPLMGEPNGIGLQSGGWS